MTLVEFLTMFNNMKTSLSEPRNRTVGIVFEISQAYWYSKTYSKDVVETLWQTLHDFNISSI